MNKKNMLRSLTASLLCLSAVSPATAALPLISEGDAILFSDDFNDNSSGWTNISVVNGTGVATSGTGEIDASAWSPAAPGDNSEVASTLVLPESVNVLDGDISVYFRVSAFDVSVIEVNKFSVRFSESTGDRLFGTTQRPMAAQVSSLDYRNSSGGFVTSNLSSEAPMVSEEYMDMKLSLSLNGESVDDGATIQMYYFDTTSSDYVSLVMVSSGVDLNTGIFNKLYINSRNGADGAVSFDSIVVAQAIPEVSSFALIAAMVALSILGVRRRS
ncbi:hypothetical protein [Puniceicoccus vermicola]|uniref:PEP-CTERM sorting domain-containing protein n=1 Tax=Puniceicoccus vermicola TaxID=388746 RepID=A0A7X1B2A5_9BACT|nr:hypothetical protein [Puniceicoccus vermicola]MBC2604316.1 hypothetical protein [Puniceicoccus vermicola]